MHSPRIAILLVTLLAAVGSAGGTPRASANLVPNQPCVAADAGVTYCSTTRERLQDGFLRNPREFVIREKLQEFNLLSLDLIVELTHDENARRCRDFQRANAYPAITFGENADDYIALDSPPALSHYPLAMHVVTNEDLEAFPGLRKSFVKDGLLGDLPHYNTSHPWLRVRYDPLWSHVYTGLLNFHEACHAEGLSKLPSGTVLDYFELAHEEIRVYSLQTQLVTEIGKGPYNQLVIAEMLRISVDGSAIEREHGSIFTARMGAYETKLDKIFGSAKTDSERAMRSSLLYIQANLNLIDILNAGLSPEEIGDLKADWFQISYLAGKCENTDGSERKKDTEGRCR